MRTFYQLTLCLGALLLATEAAARAPNEPCPKGPAVAPLECRQPGAAREARQAALTPSRASAGAVTLPEVASRNSEERPEEFWWRSPEEVLESLYGACGVRDCCKYCVKGKACGDTCIERTNTCHVGCGCACQKPLFFGES